MVLRRGGAVPIGIGIGNADITEMQTISFIPDFAVVVPTFRQLGWGSPGKTTGVGCQFLLHRWHTSLPFISH